MELSGPSVVSANRGQPRQWSAAVMVSASGGGQRGVACSCMACAMLGRWSITLINTVFGQGHTGAAATIL